MKKIISISLCICLVFSSFTFAFAAVQDVSDATTHTRLQTIITWLQNTAPTYNGQSLINNNIIAIKNIITKSITIGGFTGDFVDWTAKGVSILDDINNALNGSNGSGGIATILSNILTELTWTNAGGTVIHGIQTIMTYISNIRTYTNNIQSYTNTINQNVASIGIEVLSSFPATVQKLTSIDSTLSSTYTLENNTLPGIYAYSGSIDGTTQAMYTLDQLNGMEAFGGGSTVTVRGLTSAGGENINTYNFSSNNWRSNLGRFAQYINNNVVRGFSFITYGFNTTQTRTNWKTLASETYTPISTTDGVYYWLGSIQTPIARLASIYASDEEIAAREKAADNQARAVNTFVDQNGLGALPGASINNLGGLSSNWKTNLDVGVSTSRFFDVFNSNHGDWFSQETANQLDTTSSGNRSKSESSFETPLLDQKINEIYEEIGVKK